MKKTGFFARLLDLIAPRQCPVCGQRLSVSEELICTVCNLRLPRTHFAHSPTDNEMARMFWGRIPLEKAMALLRFEPKSQTAQLIYDLKYHNHPEYGSILGKIAAEDCKRDYNTNLTKSTSTIDETDIFGDINLIIPVPLTTRRQRKRGYNQGLEIARGISQATGIPIEQKAVRRKDFKESQTRKNWWERHDNVENAFQLDRPERISGCHLLLVDDVMTTGATLTACAKELLKAQNVRISVLTLAFAKS